MNCTYALMLSLLRLLPEDFFMKINVYWLVRFKKFFRKVSYAKSFIGITIFCNMQTSLKKYYNKNIFISNTSRLTTFIILHFEFSKIIMTMFHVGSLKLGHWFWRRNVEKKLFKSMYSISFRVKSRFISN